MNPLDIDTAPIKAKLKAEHRLRWQNIKSKLELLSPVEAAKEKEAESHFKAIGLAISASQRAGVSLYGQMIVAGHHMEELVELLPYGQIEKRLAERFPDLSVATQKRWRQLSRDFLETVKTKELTVSLLNAKGRLKPDKKTQNTLLEIIPEIMEGRNVTDFLRDCKLMRQIEEQKGGFKYDKGRLEAWLKENHADLAGKSYEKLPPKIRREFAKWDLSQRNETPSATRLEAEAKETQQDLVRAITSPRTKGFSHEWLEKLDALAVKLHDKYRELLKADAMKGEKE